MEVDVSALTAMAGGLALVITALGKAIAMVILACRTR
jgi:hypothetical protein